MLLLSICAMNIELHRTLSAAIQHFLLNNFCFNLPVKLSLAIIVILALESCMGWGTQLFSYSNTLQSGPHLAPRIVLNRLITALLNHFLRIPWNQHISFAEQLYDFLFCAFFSVPHFLSPDLGSSEFLLRVKKLRFFLNVEL